MRKTLKATEEYLLGKNFYHINWENYLPELKKLIVPDSKTLLDVGCGRNSPISYFRDQIYSVGVDISDADLSTSEGANIHNQYVVGDIRLLQGIFLEKSFDCVLASDVIEHLTIEEGLNLIQQMEKIATKRVILFTPNGFVENDATSDNPFQEHKSGWSPSTLRKLGFRLIGIHGFKYFRREQVQARKPERLFLRLSILTQDIFLRIPDLSYHLLGYKDM